MKSILLIILGCLCLGLGAVGIVIPVLPTTPFVLLAAACFGSGSPRLYRWLTNTAHFGPFIVNYRTKSGVPRMLKVKAIAFLWIMMMISILLVKSPTVKIILILIAAAVTAHISMLKTKK